MSLARLVITAVKVEGRTKSDVARDYGITRFWVQTLVKRFDTEGEVAFEPHSRRPHTTSQVRAPSSGTWAPKECLVLDQCRRSASVRPGRSPVDR